MMRRTRNSPLRGAIHLLLILTLFASGLHPVLHAGDHHHGEPNGTSATHFGEGCTGHDHAEGCGGHLAETTAPCSVCALSRSEVVAPTPAPGGLIERVVGYALSSCSLIETNSPHETLTIRGPPLIVG